LKGQEIKVNIDDRLPYKERRYVNGGTTGYYYEASLVNTKKSPNGAYWGTLMEKAAAKYYGNYERMEGGNMQEALYMLTGMPTRSFSTSDETTDELYTLVKQMDDAKWVMTTSNHRRNYGLPGGHAYTLLGAVTLNDGTKLVKIRNPWGSEAYTGPYSDSSNEMTEAVRTELGHEI
jgi:glycosidase